MNCSIMIIFVLTCLRAPQPFCSSSSRAYLYMKMCRHAAEGLQVLLANIAAELEGGLQLLRDQGFAPLRKQYLHSWLHTGQKVQ